MTNISHLQAALKYHSLGYQVIPLCIPDLENGGCIQHGRDCSHPGKVPLVKWKERTKIMRQVEGQAAQEMASQLGQAILQGNSQVINAIHGMAAAAQKEPPGPNPMASMMANTMAPVFQQIMGNLMTTFMRPQGIGLVPPQPGQSPHTGQPLQYQKAETGGFEGADEEDVRRAFDE